MRPRGLRASDRDLLQLVRFVGHVCQTEHVTDFEPFDLDDEALRAFKALRSGLPEDLYPSVAAWVMESFDSSNSGWIQASKVRAAQEATSVLLTSTTHNLVDGSALRTRLGQLSDTDVLQVVHYLLSGMNEYSRMPLTLEGILVRGRSRYAVVSPDEGRHHALTHRVAEGVQAASEDVIRESGTAGKHLKRAWEAIHALEPNPSFAYWCAVQAIESASGKVVVSADKQATLGKVKKRMIDDGDWRVPLVASPTHATDQLPLEMARAVWEGHNGRHGEKDFKDVTYEQARVAVMLAVTLVDLFEAGIIKRDGS